MQPANATELAKRRGVDVPRLVALLRGDLDWIVMRCLEKDRTRRYETASGVAQDIKRHLHHEPVAARPPSAAYRFRKLVRRNRLAVAAAGAVLLVLVLGIVGSTWQAVRATRAEREQIRFRMQAQANEQKALAAEALEASQRQEAEAARRQAQGNAYAAEMNLAQEAYAEGRLARAVSLLENHVPGPGKAEDLRGFEWRYLWRICHEGDALVTTPAEKSPVAAVGFTASGQLVTCSSVGVVSVFDLASRKHRVRFGMQGTADAVPIPSKAEAAPALGNVRLRRWELHTRLAVSRNGEVVAGAFGEGVISLCRIAEKPESLTVPVDGGRPGIALSPDGRLLAFPAEKGIRLWDCIQRRELGLVPGQRRSGLLMFSRDGSLLAKGEGSAVQIIDVTNRAELFRLEALHTAEVLAGAFSPDGRTLATSGWDTSIKLTDLASRQVIASLRGNTTHAWHLEFSPDGRTLATAGDSEVVTIWDVSDRTAATPIRTLRGHRDKVTALAFSADGKTVATGSADGTAKVSRIDETSSDLLEGHDQWAFSVAFSPESKVLASGSFDGTIRFWDSRTGNPTAVIRAAPSSVYTVAFTPDGRLLAGCEARWYSTPSTTRTRNRIRLWKVADQSEVLSLAEGTFPRALDISPDGRILAGGDAAPMGQVTLWDIPSGKEIANIKTPRSGNSTVRFSPDGRFLATSGYMGEAKLWNVATRQEIARFDSENESFGPNVDFSPDSQTLAIGWYELELWSTEDHRPLVKLAGHRAPIMSVRYSPDGKTIATGSMDHSVKLWNVATRREVATLQGHTGAVSGLAFSADGTMLASSSEDKTIRIWRAISAAEAAALKSR
jgi:WD40 repeat protein